MGIRKALLNKITRTRGKLHRDLSRLDKIYEVARELDRQGAGESSWGKLAELIGINVHILDRDPDMALQPPQANTESLERASNRELTDRDRALLNWLRDHPEDPRAEVIASKFTGNNDGKQ